MDWNKIGKFLKENSDDIQKVAKDASDLAKNVSKFHQINEKRKEEKAEREKMAELNREKFIAILESVQPQKVSISEYDRNGNKIK